MYCIILFNSKDIMALSEFSIYDNLVTDLLPASLDSNIEENDTMQNYLSCIFLQNAGMFANYTA